MIFKGISAIAAAAILATAISPAAAGGKPVACYERYRTAPVYDTIHENVMVNPGYRHVETVPPIYGTQTRRVQVGGGGYSYKHVPAVVQTRYRTVKVEGSSYGWEWRWINGRKVLCKVKRGAHYERVAETIVVREAYKRRVAIPAQYAYETEQVLIQPRQKRGIDVPASYQTVARQVLVSEGESGWKRIKIRRHCG